MLQFSLQRLLVSFTLLAVGVFMAVRIFRYHLWTGPEFLPQWFISGAMVGAGIFTPFRRTILGIVIGLAVPAVLALLLVLLALYAMGHSH